MELDSQLPYQLHLCTAHRSRGQSWEAQVQSLAPRVPVVHWTSSLPSPASAVPSVRWGNNDDDQGDDNSCRFAVINRIYVHLRECTVLKTAAMNMLSYPFLGLSFFLCETEVRVFTSLGSNENLRRFRIKRPWHIKKTMITIEYHQV